MTYEEAKKHISSEVINLIQNRGNCITEAKIEACKLAIEALEKQIPKKVGKMKETDYGSPYYCPECEAEIIPVEFFKDDGSEPEEKVSYCWKCGQAIDWSE